jgi:hypothetical protein
MKAYLLPKSSDLVACVSSALTGVGKDYSGNLVVFPGRRPAHFLRRQTGRKQGQAFIPPRIFSMDDFIDFVHERQTADHARKIEGLDAVALLFRLHRKAERPVGGRGFFSPDSFFPLGLRIYRDLEELCIEDISVEAVKGLDSLIQEGMPQKSVERLQSLSYFYKGFYRELHEKGLTTRSLQYSAAPEIVDAAGLTEFTSIIFAGFFAFTSAERRMVKKLAEYESASFIFQDGPGIEQQLSSLGIDYERAEGDVRTPVISFYRSPDTHGQAFALNRLINEGARSGILPDERTVIVLPSSDTLFPVLHHGIPEISYDSLNISMGYPLRRTPIFGFFNSLAQLMLSMDENRLYLPDYLKFVLHPYVKNILFRGRADTTRIIFHTIEDVMTEGRNRTFSDLNGIEQDLNMINAIQVRMAQTDEGTTTAEIQEHLGWIHDNLIRKFLPLTSLADFALKSSDVLKFIYENSTARLHPYFHPFSEAFISAMQTISNSLMKDMAFEETQSYFNFFRKYLLTCHVPFAGTPLRGLQVLGFLETRNLSFERVFILDMNEDVIPATDRDGSLLPLMARSALGLPTYTDRDRITAYYFDTLIHTALEVHLFSVENDRKDRSRFVEKLLWEQQRYDHETRPDKYVQAVFYDIRLGNRVPAPVAKSEAVVELLRDFEFSATALDTYLTCPLRFYYRYVLLISEKEGVTGELGRADIGRFVHDVLHSYFSDRQGRPLTEADLNEVVMERLIDQKFSGLYGTDPAGAAWLLKTQIQKHLRDFLRGHQSELLRRGPVAIMELECDLKISWNSFTLRGRIDRVEDRNGRIFIIDYKTQANDHYLRILFDRLDPDDRVSWHKAIGSLQLPLYALLWSVARGMPLGRINPLFLLLGKVRLDMEIEVPLFGETSNIHAGVGVLQDIILKLLVEITDVNRPFAPAYNMKEACPRCDFRYICGTQWIVNKRQ